MNAIDTAKSATSGDKLEGHRPLYVDLDGTLLATDSLWEALLVLLRREPLMLLSVMRWLFRGKAFFKRQVAQRVELNPRLLPYREDVLSFLRRQKAMGKELILASASDKGVTEVIAHHLGLFTTTIGSDGAVNLSGEAKLRAIYKQTQGSEFDYMGNSAADLPLLNAAATAILVHPSARTLRRANGRCSPVELLSSRSGLLGPWIKALRLHQWIKNVLLFVPLLMAHRVLELDLVFKTGAGFIAFGLCASSMYVMNDLLDLEADRQHPRKRYRAFAAGLLQIKTGVLVAPLLLIAAFGVALVFLPPNFTFSLVLYLVVATGYSFHLKRVLLVDVFVLAGLYSLRILAGAVSVGVAISPWLLAFSMFLFLSLAFLKRYAELRAGVDRNSQESNARGYFTADIDLIRSLGSTSGYISVLVLALYINSREVIALYRYPELLWLVGPCLLYWVTRVWFVAHRGNMDDDPVVFALKDKVSYLVGCVVVAVIASASW